jgi:hypothetical protein
LQEEQGLLLQYGDACIQLNHFVGVHEGKTHDAQCQFV